ncbi:MAG TPA: ester cyclase, partial [Chloroflexia bacterium]|nr:ester cyclase [Chloroflexia bacterium]
DALEEGDKVVVTWRLKGNWSRPFLGIKPTNQPIELTGINIYRFDGDKIVETNGEFNLAGLAQQVLAGGVSMSECAQALQALARTNDSPEQGEPA